MDYILNIAGLAVSLLILVWSADIFVGGCVSLARRCGVSPLLIGMLIIGFGTSAPEMLVSLLSAMEGNPSIALGNAFGSSICNIGLILGLTAALCPITVARGVLRREMPVLIGTTIFAWGLLADRDISRIDAFLLLGVFALVTLNNIWQEKNHPAPEEDESSAAPVYSLGGTILRIVGGLAILVGSSRLLVLCAVNLARLLGVPDLIVGLTIVAIGTSLPELASSLVAIKRREHDLALGNIIGSNLFNLLAVVGIAGSVAPMTGADDAETIRAVLRRDFPVMFFITIFLMATCIPFKKGFPARINRGEGLFLLAVFIAYLVKLVLDAMRDASAVIS